MSQFTQKYAIVQFFERISVGSTFPSSNWPLHSTVADTFAIDWNHITLTDELTQLLKSHENATSVTQEDRFFGDNNQTLVALLQKTDSLVKLHYDVVGLLERGGWKPNDPKLQRRAFCHMRPYNAEVVLIRAMQCFLTP
ncbi:MAG TPA: hypothetical protein VFZ48_02200 [Candidatus Saccharimonadales bacterium]